MRMADLRPLFAGLPRLRTLRAALVPEDAVQAQERWTSLAQALLLCTQLTALRLRCVFLKDELLLPVLRAVPQLQSLLVEQAQLSSLRCLLTCLTWQRRCNSWISPVVPAAWRLTSCFRGCVRSARCASCPSSA